MYLSYLGSSIITTKLIFPNEDLLNIGKIFGQSGIIAVGMLIGTVLFNVIRAYRVCPAKSYGVASGFSLSLFAIIFAIVPFIGINMTTIVWNIFTTIIPFLSNYTELFKGLVVALMGVIGYWFGRIFMPSVKG